MSPFPHFNNHRTQARAALDGRAGSGAPVATTDTIAGVVVVVGRPSYPNDGAPATHDTNGRSSGGGSPAPDPAEKAADAALVLHGAITPLLVRRRGLAGVLRARPVLLRGLGLPAATIAAVPRAAAGASMDEDEGVAVLEACNDSILTALTHISPKNKSNTHPTGSSSAAPTIGAGM